MALAEKRKAQCFGMMLSLAAKKVDVVRQHIGQQMKLVDNEKRKLGVLQGYRRDYVSRLSVNMHSGITSEVYDNSRNFIALLDKAIAGQHQSLQNAESALKAAQSSLLTVERERLKFDVITNKIASRFQERSRKLEQKQNDEFAANMARR